MLFINNIYKEGGLMELFVKLECSFCRMKYYLNFKRADLEIPPDIKFGEVFECRCPICEEGTFAILSDSRKGRINRINKLWR